MLVKKKIKQILNFIKFKNKLNTIKFKIDFSHISKKYF